MRTCGDALEWAVRFLSSAGVPEPRLHATLLMAASALKSSPSDTDYLAKLREIRLRQTAHPESLLEHPIRFRTLVWGRASGFPTAYILGWVEFMGLEFLVNKSVFVPCSETEGLVEEAIRLLSPVPSPRVLEIGVGSGCISVSLAHFLPSVRVNAVDVSPDALSVARRNARRLGVSKRIRITEWDVMSDKVPPFPLERRFDAVLSNPPDVAFSEQSILSREVLSEPAIAVFAGEDKFPFVDLLLDRARTWLKPGGWLLMEVGHTMGRETVRRAKKTGWKEPTALKDPAGIPRIVRMRL